MLWKKPADLKYTDLCIFIDENVPNILGECDTPELKNLANTIYNYIWLIVKALAIKKRMFNSFSDYDGYAFYAANRLFFALKKSYLNEGKVIKGKTIRPIKSILNYTKKLLNPMKLEYQKETYNEVLSEDFTSKKFDAFNFKEKLKQDAQDAQNGGRLFKDYTTELFKSYGGLLDNILQNSPFTPNSVDYKHLKISILLNCWNSLKVKNRLGDESSTIILWKLPKSLSGYVRLLIKEFNTALKTEIMDSYSMATVGDDMLEKLITNPEGDFIEHED